MDRHTCPRRFEACAYGFGKENQDTWCGHRGDGTCSYCGSLHPDKFMELARAGAELGPTDKNYKVYVTGGASPKFYFQHLSEEQRKEFVELLNAGALKIGIPGHFYQLPFFCRRAE